MPPHFSPRIFSGESHLRDDTGPCIYDYIKPIKEELPYGTEIC